MAVRNILKMLSVAMFATTAGGTTLAGDKVVMVGKRMNNLTVLPAGRGDFPKTGNLLLSFDNIRNELPMLFVIANIHKDPPCVLANHGKNNGFSGQSQAPAVLISKDGKGSLRNRRIVLSPRDSPWNRNVIHSRHGYDREHPAPVRGPVAAS